ELIFIPKEKFIQLMRTDPDISLRMLAGFAKRMKALVEKLDNLSNKEVTNRLCEYLYKEVMKNGTDKLPEPFLKFSVPKTTIAAYIGTITETLSRTLKKLQDEGILRVNGKTIFILDFRKLKETALL
ncbi:MAG: Crp/Fnr family transcriptional regulator, partial [Ignavibacteriales bacterium]|nr:Crp/Fnr family transcriptional regulator [Ignavibacteriales bacterium]